MHSTETLLDKLIASDLYRRYERFFGDATGLPLTLREPDAWQVAQKLNPNRNPFCAMMADGSRSCAACLQVQDQLSGEATDKPASATCYAGLTDSAVPVRVGDEIIGYLQTGQVSLVPPTEEGFEKVRERLENLQVQAGSEALKSAWMASPHWPRHKYEAAVELLHVFADQLSQLSNQLFLQQRNAEPPAITRAKHYIEEHLSQDLDLGTVAQVVHMSRFYFCKMFRKATGLNFTDYVARLRVERAKELLLNPNLRVSEIAYEVGFQSLTHFNRVFRKVVGQSPSDYRAHVPVG